jgi:hypothetical protein
MSADRSYTEYVRRKRAVAQAVRRTACAACPEEGPIRVTDKATQLSRVFGQQAYLRPQANGEIIITCCGSTPAPPPPPPPPSCVYIPACSGVISNLQIPGPGITTLTSTSCYRFNNQSGITGILTLTFADGVSAGCISMINGAVYPPTNGITGLISAEFGTVPCTLPPPGPLLIDVSVSPSGTFDAATVVFFNNPTGVGVWMTVCFGTRSTIFIPAGSYISIAVGEIGTADYVISATP